MCGDVATPNLYVVAQQNCLQAPDTKTTVMGRRSGSSSSNDDVERAGVKGAFFFVRWECQKLVNNLVLLVRWERFHQLSHYLHFNPGTEIINVPLCFLGGTKHSMYVHENVSW